MADALPGSGRKIAIIHSIYKPYYRGGAEVVVEDIAKGLKDKGEDVFIIALGYENKMEEIDGIKVYRIKPFNIFNYLDINSKPFWLRIFWHVIDAFNDVQTWRVYKVLQNEKPDAVMMHNIKGLGYYIPRILQILKIKTYYTIHDAQLIHPSGLIQKNPNLNFQKIYNFVCKKLLGKIDVIIYPSKFYKDEFTRLGFFKDAKVEVLPNPIQSLPNGPKNDVLSEAVNLAYVGQIEPYKGVFDLLEAFQSAIVRLNLPVNLHFIGGGSILDEIKEKAKNSRNIIFWDRLSREEMEKQIWPMVDLLINPSQTPESFGMVVIEANAKGLPVLSSRAGALPELIEEEKNGWLFDAENVAELADKIVSICNKEKLKSMENDCMESAKKYDLKNYIDKLNQL